MSFFYDHIHKEEWFTFSWPSISQIIGSMYWFSIWFHCCCRHIFIFSMQFLWSRDTERDVSWGWMCYHSNKLTHWQDCTISFSHRVSATDVANELWSFPAFVDVGRVDTPVKEERCHCILRLGRKDDHGLPCSLYNHPSLCFVCSDF